jgi:cytochrome c oxidase subunit II
MGVVGAVRPPSNVETIDPTTLHLGGEFAESNLGTAQETDGSHTVRLVAGQYGFTPDCTKVAVDTPVKFRLTSADVIHGFLLPSTNVNTMVMPGFVAEVRTRFSRPGIYRMPCNEFCGAGHHGMWARVSVVTKDQFQPLTQTERTSCVQQ